MFRIVRNTRLLSVIRNVSYAKEHAEASPKEYYKVLTSKVQQRQFLAKHDLRHIILKCRENKDFQHAMKTVALYQRQSFDFTEEICSHMVHIAVEKNREKSLVDMMNEPDHRLGAWLSRKSLNTLAEKLLEKQDFESLNTLLHVIKKRYIAQIIDPTLVAKLKEAVKSVEGNEKAVALGETLSSLP